jgi:hypothetical protein
MTLRVGVTLGVAERYFHPEVMDEVSRFFMKNVMLSTSVPGSLASEWQKRVSKSAQYALQPISETLFIEQAGKLVQNPNLAKYKQVDNVSHLKKLSHANHWAKYQSAFASALPELWKRISQVSSTSFGATIGRNVGSMRLERSMPRGKDSDSPYHSFFMATEFGTGVFANQRFRRTKGRSKVGRRGVWAFQPSSKERSPLLLGQRPFNFLYTSTGAARPIYEQLIRKRLGSIFKKVFRKIRRSRGV